MSRISGIGGFSPGLFVKEFKKSSSDPSPSSSLIAADPKRPPETSGYYSEAPPYMALIRSRFGPAFVAIGYAPWVFLEVSVASSAPKRP